MSREARVDGSYVKVCAVFFNDTHSLTHTTTDAILSIPAACCGVSQDLSCSAPSQDIPLKLAKTCLKTDPCFHSVLKDKGEGGAAGEHGGTTFKILVKGWRV